MHFSNICYHTSFQGPVWIGSSHSHLRNSCFPIMLLPTVGNQEVRGWDGLQCHNVYTNFRENRLTGSKFKEKRHRHHGGLISLPFSVRKESRLINGNKTPFNWWCVRLNESRSHNLCHNNAWFPQFIELCPSDCVMDISFFLHCRLWMCESRLAVQSLSCDVRKEIKWRAYLCGA